MKKQHLEGYISKALNNTTEKLWFQKNMVMPLAFHKSVGDFIILTTKNNFILECKESKIKDGRVSFSLKRLTQLHDLQLFQNSLERNISLIGILLWEKNLKNSELFIIPLRVYNSKLKDWSKKSFNREDLNKLFVNCKIENFDKFIDDICMEGYYDKMY